MQKAYICFTITSQKGEAHGRVVGCFIRCDPWHPKDGASAFSCLFPYRNIGILEGY